MFYISASPGFLLFSPVQPNGPGNLGGEPVSPITLAQNKWDMKKRLRKKTKSGLNLS